MQFNFDSTNYCIILNIGRVDEWFKSHAWKACSESML